MWKKNYVKNLIFLLFRYLDFCKFLIWKLYENVYFGIKLICKSLFIFIKRSFCGICIWNKLISRLNLYYLSYRDIIFCWCVYFYSGMKLMFMLWCFVLKSWCYGDLCGVYLILIIYNINSKEIKSIYSNRLMLMNFVCRR